MTFQYEVQMIIQIKDLDLLLELKTWAKVLWQPALYSFVFWANYSIGFVKTIYNPVTALLPSIGCALENGISGGIGVNTITRINPSVIQSAIIWFNQTR